MKIKMNNTLIASCGMNCGVCLAYLREKNKCHGCRSSDKGKPITRLECKIKKCEKLESEFCFDFMEYPCKRLKELDKRYRIKYKMSMINNLNNIKAKGLERFMESENERWRCHNCGGTICVHKGYCLSCKN